ncbi:Glycosyl hydrolases family 43 [Pirellulimonas nuda]|uniref:Glycosyl hydrolases family 43 n=1 Tax=Pirellulimonas nuda TaxID=2528009 RepID=A0A518DDS4_9BACT|nr:family 43 glycosylhydrolase [Pirellulimonas nuda]QDU89629.1 Glycosyl hydrolases family 43 [Pirellulimonas nuda]
MQKLLSILAWAAFAAYAAAAPKAASPHAETVPGRWSIDRVRAWSDARPWPVGANFVPSTAINQLEMWQAETFDPETIDRELGWASSTGMNAMRVFLHDIPWREDKQGFIERIEQYLTIADRHGIKTLFVFFDGVWNPQPRAGRQPPPRPHVHNSGWVQSPGVAILRDPGRHAELEGYVKGVLTRFADDPRILGWDLFNEPDNSNGRKFAEEMPPDEKHERACDLLLATFRWAREVAPSQPLTVGVWGGFDWLDDPEPIESISLNNSDVVSFHTYDAANGARETIRRMAEATDRPLWCTEYMARGPNSTFEGVLPVLQQHRVGAFNWGLVDGKTQTIYPWDSWTTPYDAEPALWFHDVFRRDGTPYRSEETDLVRRLTAATNRPDEAPPAEAMSKADIRKGIEAHDRALFIKAGWIRDPYIVVGPDGDFYLTGTTSLREDPRQQSDPYNTGLGEASLVGWKARVWRSSDLADWEEIDPPFTLRDGVWAKTRPNRFKEIPERDWRLWAPELHWTGDRWALVQTSPAPVRGANLSLSAGKELKGPWQNPMGQEIGTRHDPSLYKDDDGQWWLIYGATLIAPLKPDFSGLAGDPVAIGPSGNVDKMGHEGCFIRKFGGKYVLFGTGWSTGRMRQGSYNLYYAVADKITGPYGPRKFAGRFLGHGTLFQDRAGQWWCTAFYNANVPPLGGSGIVSRDLSATAQTINQLGTTIVPMEIDFDDQGEPRIRSKDPRYAIPGPDEGQEFHATVAEEYEAR